MKTTQKLTLASIIIGVIVCTASITGTVIYNKIKDDILLLSKISNERKNLDLESKK